MALHEQSAGASDEWYTPAHVFEAMAVHFAVDGAAGPPEAPWAEWCDRGVFSDGLAAKWRGPVWLNPPFGGRSGIEPWLAKFMAYPGGGVALAPDRTSAPWFQVHAPKADRILFIAPKLKFISGDGRSNRSPAQGTCLMGRGPVGMRALANARQAGLGVLMQPKQVLL